MVSQAVTRAKSAKSVIVLKRAAAGIGIVARPLFLAGRRCNPPYSVILGHTES
jgi:hypothetical protein